MLFSKNYANATNAKPIFMEENMKLKSSPLAFVASILYATVILGVSLVPNQDSNKETPVEFIQLTASSVPSFKHLVVHNSDYLERVWVDKNVTVMAVKTPKRVVKQIPSDTTKRCPEFEHKFVEYGLPVELFSYIAWRESRCRIKAINAKFDSNGNVTWTLNKNGSIDRGLLQINSTWKTVTKNICGTDLEGLMILDCNLSVARYLFRNGGAGHWGF